MKIPDNFKQKYSLKGDSYPAANADAALSELFAVSGRLYKENADLKAEVARLREEAERERPAATEQAVDLSGIEKLVSALSAQIEAVRTSVNDALCVANDAAISAKKAEDSAELSKEASVSALNEVRSLEEKLASVPMILPAVYPEGRIDDTTAENDTEPAAPPQTGIAPPAKEEDIAAFEELEQVPEMTLASSEPEAACDEPKPEPIIEVVPESEPEIEPEIEPETEPETAHNDDGDLADELIRSAGLDGAVEEIEPAEQVSEEELSERLAKMYTDTDANTAADADEPEPASTQEEAPPQEEKPSPTSFSDMKSALDAIRARLKK